MKTQKHYFYVLKCQDNTYYAGYTTDIERRLAEHNKGVGAKYTRVKKRQPMALIFYTEFPTKRLALQQEYAFKQLTRSQKEIFFQEPILK